MRDMALLCRIWAVLTLTQPNIRLGTEIANEFLKLSNMPIPISYGTPVRAIQASSTQQTAPKAEQKRLLEWIYISSSQV